MKSVEADRTTWSESIFTLIVAAVPSEVTLSHLCAVVL